MTTVLPKTSQFGHYRLPCESIIYCSGREEFMREGVMMRPPNPGKYTLWVCTKIASEGRAAEGYIVMDRNGPLYFDTPKEAMEHLSNIKQSQDYRKQ